MAKKTLDDFEGGRLIGSDSTDNLVTSTGISLSTPKSLDDFDGGMTINQFQNADQRVLGFGGEPTSAYERKEAFGATSVEPLSYMKYAATSDPQVKLQILKDEVESRGGKWGKVRYDSPTDSFLIQMDPDGKTGLQEYFLNRPKFSGEDVREFASSAIKALPEGYAAMKSGGAVLKGSPTISPSVSRQLGAIGAATAAAGGTAAASTGLGRAITPDSSLYPEEQIEGYKRTGTGAKMVEEAVWGMAGEGVMGVGGLGARTAAPYIKGVFGKLFNTNPSYRALLESTDEKEFAKGVEMAAADTRLDDETRTTFSRMAKEPAFRKQVLQQIPDFFQSPEGIQGISQLKAKQKLSDLLDSDETERIAKFFDPEKYTGATPEYKAKWDEYNKVKKELEAAREYKPVETEMEGIGIDDDFRLVETPSVYENDVAKVKELEGKLIGIKTELTGRRATELLKAPEIMMSQMINDPKINQSIEKIAKSQQYRPLYDKLFKQDKEMIDFATRLRKVNAVIDEALNEGKLTEQVRSEEIRKGFGEILAKREARISTGIDETYNMIREKIGPKGVPITEPMDKGLSIADNVKTLLSESRGEDKNRAIRIASKMFKDMEIPTREDLGLSKAVASEEMGTTAPTGFESLIGKKTGKKKTAEILALKDKYETKEGVKTARGERSDSLYFNAEGIGGENSIDVLKRSLHNITGKATNIPENATLVPPIQNRVADLIDSLDAGKLDTLDFRKFVDKAKEIQADPNSSNSDQMAVDKMFAYLFNNVTEKGGPTFRDVTKTNATPISLFDTSELPEIGGSFKRTSGEELLKLKGSKYIDWIADDMGDFYDSASSIGVKGTANNIKSQFKQQIQKQGEGFAENDVDSAYSSIKDMYTQLKANEGSRAQFMSELFGKDLDVMADKIWQQPTDDVIKSFEIVGKASGLTDAQSTALKHNMVGRIFWKNIGKKMSAISTAKEAGEKQIGPDGKQIFTQKDSQEALLDLRTALDFDTNEWEKFVKISQIDEKSKEFVDVVNDLRNMTNMASRGRPSGWVGKDKQLDITAVIPKFGQAGKIVSKAIDIVTPEDPKRMLDVLTTKPIPSTVKLYLKQAVEDRDPERYFSIIDSLMKKPTKGQLANAAGRAGLYGGIKENQQEEMER